MEEPGEESEALQEVSARSVDAMGEHPMIVWSPVQYHVRQIRACF